MNTESVAKQLRSVGLKSTAGRTQLLEILSAETKPRTIRELSAKLPSPLDEVTLYRALEAFLKAGLVQQVDLQHGHAHYELAVERLHHHHLVCTNCGVVEDFTQEGCEVLLSDVAKKSSMFKKVTSHSMEMFGLCATCV